MMSGGLLRVDGSMGEGGGQIFRTTIALAALTGRDVEIYNIRRRRKKPGLRPQHLTALGALAEITGAEVEGKAVGSERVVFRPGKIVGGEYRFSVGTAGSVTLVLQALLPVMVFSDREWHVTLEGGTDVPWSPPSDYFSHVFIPLIRKMGARVDFSVKKRGFYPGGGGVVDVHVEGRDGLGPLRLVERGTLEELALSCVISGLPDHICRRIGKRFVETARKRLGDIEVNVSSTKTAARDPGVVAVGVAGFSNTVLGCGMPGRRGLRSETIGETIAGELLKDIVVGATVDVHAMDQVAVYMALAGGESTVFVREISSHASTCMSLVEMFTGKHFMVEKVSEVSATGRDVYRVAVAADAGKREEMVVGHGK